MNFVALVSGGKDSFFNIMECMKNGHTLKALANLYPCDTSVNEIDSFMFQTVGHDIIDKYRQCVGDEVSLYRRPIKGSSSNVSLEYSVTQDDEIEDLYELLKEIKELDPQIQGVSCGAILSHYQRTRVENVCDRLGLTCLAYLWQRDQSELMSEMCVSGLEAIFIKVAGAGLSEKHLGKSLVDLHPTLIKLNSMFGSHICGEGGEFETLVLDAPFFKKKLSVSNKKVIHHSMDSSYLCLEVEVVDKPKIEQTIDLEFPSLLSEDFESLRQGIVEPTTSVAYSKRERNLDFFVKPHIVQLGGRVYISNITSTLESTKEQAEDILSQISQALSEYGSSASQIKHMTVFLEDINEFNELNTAYARLFAEIHLPPSRVCIETTLPNRCKVQISCIASTTHSSKTGIHIRSRSYWAPHNIGPYSQAILDMYGTTKVATLSGQIPLNPRSMELLDSNPISFQSLLSLQHLHRVKSLINVGKIAACFCFISGQVSPVFISELWRSYVSDVANDAKYFERLFILDVPNLPRNSSIEWAGLSYEEQYDMYADDSDNDESSLSPYQDNFMDQFKPDTISLGDIYLSRFFGNNIDDLIEVLRASQSKGIHVTVIADITIIQKLSSLNLSAEWMPVLNIYDSHGVKSAYGVVSYSNYERKPVS